MVGREVSSNLCRRKVFKSKCPKLKDGDGVKESYVIKIMNFKETPQVK